MYQSVKYIHGGKFVSRGEWIHSERVIDSTELIIMLKGIAYMEQDGIPYTLTPGDVLVLEEGLRHRGTAVSPEPVSFYWIHCIGVEKSELPSTYFRPESTAQAELICRQLLHYAFSEEYPREILDSLMRVLLIELKTSEQRVGIIENHLCASIREWIRINSDLPLKVSDVAQEFHYNEDYLNRQFRRFYLGGVKACIDEMKMLKIKKELLNNTVSLQELSEKYGFQDYKYFLKYFKYHEGITPTQYRRLYDNIHLNNQ